MGEIRSRKWLLTINNPIEKGYTHEVLKRLISETKQCVYWCMSDEVGNETGTHHTHVYMACSSAVRFNVLVKRFAGAHFDVAKGTSAENRNYVFKSGKWSADAKAETNLRDTHEEGGDMPVERQGARNDIADLYDMVKQGMSNYEILEAAPNYLLHIDKIEKARLTVTEEKYKDLRRIIDITYIYGLTGTGKTRSVMDKYGYSNVYRVTDYKHPFDGYKGQDVIVFEEFRSSLSLGNMLTYLDEYPVELPCRYANRMACFTKVYIISNISLREQYTGVQRYEFESYNAFLRRINRVKVFTKKDVKEYTVDEYMNGFVTLGDRTDCPFNGNDMEEKLYNQLSFADRGGDGAERP